METIIDWDDFETYLRDMAIGAGDEDKKYFESLADSCGSMIMTDELSTWYDKGNYRSEL